MPRLIWTPGLSVGIDEIDRQHQELVKRINRLMDGMEAGNGPGEVKYLLDYLEEYVRFHFAGEEEQMRHHGYPRRADHEREHVEFVNDMAKLRAEHQMGGATVGFIVEFNNRVCSWLVRHIMRTDVALGAFLKPLLARSAQGAS